MACRRRAVVAAVCEATGPERSSSNKVQQCRGADEGQQGTLKNASKELHRAQDKREPDQDRRLISGVM